jgi:hypothetical protein
VGFMEQLTTRDAGFLHAEDSDRHVSPAIVHARLTKAKASGLHQAGSNFGTADSVGHWRSTPVGTFAVVQGG